MRVVDEIDVYIRRREKEEERKWEQKRGASKQIAVHVSIIIMVVGGGIDRQIKNIGRKAKTEEETGEMTHKRT